MAEFRFSGDSRYDTGAEYTKYLLESIARAEDPIEIANQIKSLEDLGTISADVAQAVTTVLHERFPRW
jgi:hypothetical protein